MREINTAIKNKSRNEQTNSTNKSIDENFNYWKESKQACFIIFYHSIIFIDQLTSVKESSIKSKNQAPNRTP